MLSRDEYFERRAALMVDLPGILSLEQEVMKFLTQTVQEAAVALHSDFSRARELVPSWISYPPKQRGRSPVGDSHPWSEVGEKSLSFNLLRAICERRNDISFPGLPFGADVRFATHEAFVHFDVKLTGPRDNQNEVVAPPQQISGDGATWNTGVCNSSFEVLGQRTSFRFQPKLPPFYVLDGRVLPCLTFFLKAVYALKGLGEQPLQHLEVACVPNGLLLFDGPLLAQTEGLFIPGKDDRSVPESDKRTRVRLSPLASLDDGWRCRQIRPQDDSYAQWNVLPRFQPEDSSVN